MKPLSYVRFLATPWTAAHQAPPSMGFSRQEYWSGAPLPSPSLAPTDVQIIQSMEKHGLEPVLSPARLLPSLPFYTRLTLSHAIQRAWLASASGPLHGLCPLLRGLNYSTVGGAGSSPFIKTPMRCHISEALPVRGSKAALSPSTCILIILPCRAPGRQSIRGSGFCRKQEFTSCQSSAGGTDEGYLGGAGEGGGDKGLCFLGS